MLTKNLKQGKRVKSTKNVFLSVVVASFFIACGGGNEKSILAEDREVVVERGPVINALVKDANNQEANNTEKNIYVFAENIKYPISVKSRTDGYTFIDTNYDFKPDENDVILDLELRSCSNKVTMISTLVANETSCDEDKVKEKYESLSSDLKILVDDLKELPSKASSTKAIILNNVIYASLQKNANATLTNEKLKSKIEALESKIEAKIKDKKDFKEIASIIEKDVIEDTNTTKLTPGKIHQAKHKNSLYVKKAIDIVDKIDFSQDNIADKLKDIKDELEKAPTADKDAKVTKAIIELAEVSNTACLADFISLDKNQAITYEDLLPSLLYSMKNKNAKIELKDGGKMQNCSNELLKNLVSKTLSAQKDIESAFSNKEYSFKHKDIELNYDDSLNIRSNALLGATILQTLLAYDKDIDAKDFKNTTEEVDVRFPRSSTDSKITATYTKYNVFPLESYYNKPNAFQVDLKALSEAKNYLQNSVTLLKDVNMSNLNTIDTKNTKDVADFKKAQEYANSILQNLQKGKVSPFTTKNNSRTKWKKYDLKVFFEKGVSKKDLTKDSFTLKCNGSAKVDINLSKVYDDTYCDDYSRATLVPKNLPSSSESSLDDIVLEIKTGQKTYKNDELIKYLLTSK